MRQGQCRRIALAVAFLGLTASSLGHADCRWDEGICTRPESEAISIKAGQMADIHHVSETFGHLVGREIQAQDLPLDIDDVIAGLRAALDGGRPPMSEQEYVEVLDRLKNREFQATADHNLALANAFMASNAKKAGVVDIIPSKVQYRILKAGSGAAVRSDSSPLVRYSGYYLDGTLFGSSDEVGGTIAIPLAQMIPGFRDGVKGMKEGEERRLFIHPDYAYGAISEIPPNSLLIFNIEIVRADGAQTPAVPGSVRYQDNSLSTSVSPAAAPAKANSTVADTAWDLRMDDEEPAQNNRFSKRPLKLQPAQ